GSAFLGLREVFKERPHLAGYVQALYTTLPQHTSSRYMHPSPGLMDKNPSAVAETLDALSSSLIHTVTLRSPPSPQYSASDWSRLPLEAQNAFYPIFAKPNLQTLVIHGLSIPKSFFREFGGLKHLKLLDVSWVWESPGVQPQSRLDEVQKLASVDIGRLQQPMALNTMTPEIGLDLGGVDHAKWWLSLPLKATPQLFPLNPEKLRAFEVRVFNEGWAPTTTVVQPLDLSSCCNLSQLTISDDGSSYEYWLNSSWVAETLSSLPLPNRIHSLVLKYEGSEIGQYSSVRLLRPALSRLWACSKDIHVLIKIELGIDSDTDDPEDEDAKLKDYVFNQVKWDGCESALQVDVSRTSCFS
ncbi:hypothetical protein BDN72DRAFT_849530, partial [Pluteus cervinus]